MKASELVLRLLNGNPEILKHQVRRLPPDTIPLDDGDPGFATPEHICEGAVEAMRQGNTHYILGRGDRDLIVAICDSLKERYNSSYDPTEIIVVNGGAGGVFLSCLAFLSPGDEAIVLDPSYALQSHCARLAGATPVLVPYAEDFSLDEDAVRRAITKKTKAILLVNPNNPTARALSHQEVEFLAKLSVQHDLLLISDEAYRDIYYDGKQHTCAGSIHEAKSHVVLVHSFSKTYAMTGWRIGYVAASPELAQAIDKIHQTSNISINVLSQKAALAALRGPQDWVTDMVREYDRRRKLLTKKLKEIRNLHCIDHDSAYYFWGRFDAKMKSAEIVNYLYGKKVAVRSGGQFGNRGEGWIRFSYCRPFEQVVEGINRIIEGFKELE